MIIMGLADDFTDNHAYVDAVSESMDYLLGRNAMDNMSQTRPADGRRMDSPAVRALTPRTMTANKDRRQRKPTSIVCGGQ